MNILQFFADLNHHCNEHEETHWFHLEELKKIQD